MARPATWAHSLWLDTQQQLCPSLVTSYGRTGDPEASLPFCHKDKAGEHASLREFLASMAADAVTAHAITTAVLAQLPGGEAGSAS